jgi:hypothetical protein
VLGGPEQPTSSATARAAAAVLGERRTVRTAGR